MKKIIFLDLDGVICLEPQWGTRFKKRASTTVGWGSEQIPTKALPLEARFDDFDEKAAEVLNQIIAKTDCEIVISSDWRESCTLEEMKYLFLERGIISPPISFTPLFWEIADDHEENIDLQYYPEHIRCWEIHKWIEENLEEEDRYVVVDDMFLGKVRKKDPTTFHTDMNLPDSKKEVKFRWGVDNFVHTPRKREGIKQTNIKEKIVEILNNESN